MKMKQLGVIDTLKPSPQKIKVPAKACTLLKQSVTSFTLRMGEHPDLIPLLKIGESPNLGESPQNQQPTLAALCQLGCFAGKKSRSSSQIFCLMVLLALQSEKHRAVWVGRDLMTLQTQI